MVKLDKACIMNHMFASPGKPKLSGTSIRLSGSISVLAAPHVAANPHVRDREAHR